MRTTCAVAVLTLLLGVNGARADEFLGSYVARISAKDHVASDGYPLDSAAQMVRQDRANWHRFGRGDREDQDDPWFGSANARTRFERLLQQPGAMSAATKRAITRGQPVVEVRVYRQSVEVDVIGN
ncbi:hypothetical protein [Oryzicola mucosus]|uniref:DUF4148 domain-containing protein n=1 Tax=Oryzicola mucosus TaxID=2767425 RepID=A0A8J6PPL8_9HYPH|nr:hypothetical protein [Oryzicola mucosus]MBD0416062.1 hypothetical protein [Oryzicola mucosus]